MIEAPDATAGAEFGKSVAINNDTLVIGARFADVEAATRVGPAYVCRLYRRGFTGKWREVQKITPDDGQSGDQFGQSVALGTSLGGKLEVGADRANGTGAVYSRPFLY